MYIKEIKKGFNCPFSISWFTLKCIVFRYSPYEEVRHLLLHKVLFEHSKSWISQNLLIAIFGQKFNLHLIRSKNFSPIFSSVQSPGLFSTRKNRRCLPNLKCKKTSHFISSFIYHHLKRQKSNFFCVCLSKISAL